MPRTVPPAIPTIAELLGKDYTIALQTPFPDVQPPFYPTGLLLLCQLRVPKKVIELAGGKTLIMPDETRDAEKFRVQVALVRAMGPAAFRNRATMEPWPEGNWCQPGDFVRVPMYGGDRVAVKDPKGSGDDEVLFITIKDLDVTGVVIGDPLTVKSVI